MNSKIVNYLVATMCLFVLSNQVSAGDLSKQKEDRLLLPVKIIQLSAKDGSTTTLKYDSLRRITNVKTVFYEADSIEKYTIERIVVYDDVSKQYRQGDAYIVDSIKVVIINKNLPNPMLEMGYKFRYSRVSPVEYEIAADNGYSVTNYSVDAKSGRLLESKICKSSDEDMCLSTEFDYDADGNISKKTYVQGISPVLGIVNAYDDRRGAFINTRTPQWLFYEYLSSIFYFGLVNNIVSQVSDDDCKVIVAGSYLYNTDGYPIKYVSETHLSGDESALCLYPDNQDCSIEYDLVDRLQATAE